MPIGAAALCCRTPGVHMLEGRDDLGVLWDLRVDTKFKRQGIGQQLFDLVKAKAKQLGLRQLKIECQNMNVPAVNFYLKQGAQFGAVNRYAYKAVSYTHLAPIYKRAILFQQFADQVHVYVFCPYRLIFHSGSPSLQFSFYFVIIIHVFRQKKYDLPDWRSNPGDLQVFGAH